MAYNFVFKEPNPIVIMSGDSSLREHHLFPVLKQNLGCHKFKDECKKETDVIRWLITQNVVGDFSAKLRQNIYFKVKIWKGNLHENSNGNFVGVVDLATSKDLSRAQCFHIETLTSTIWLSLTRILTIILVASSWTVDGIPVYLLAICQRSWLWYWSLSGGCESQEETVSE